MFRLLDDCAHAQVLGRLNLTVAAVLEGLSIRSFEALAVSHRVCVVHHVLRVPLKVLLIRMVVKHLVLPSIRVLPASRLPARRAQLKHIGLIGIRVPSKRIPRPVHYFRILIRQTNS